MVSFLSGNFSHHQFLPIKENRGGRRRRRRRVKRTDANKAFSSSSSSFLHASGREEKFTVCWLVRFMEEGGEEEEEERPPLAFLYFNPPLFSRIKRHNFQKEALFPPWPWLWTANVLLACLAHQRTRIIKGPSPRIPFHFSHDSGPFFSSGIIHGCPHSLLSLPARLHGRREEEEEGAKRTHKRRRLMNGMSGRRPLLVVGLVRPPPPPPSPLFPSRRLCRSLVPPCWHANSAPPPLPT